MICWPVSPRVGCVKNNDPNPIAPIARSGNHIGIKKNGGNMTQARVTDDLVQSSLMARSIPKSTRRRQGYPVKN
jgi:hypothetical protein